MRVERFLPVLILLLTPSLAHAEIEHIRLPEGFKIGLYADGVPTARSMARGEKGTVFVAAREAGKVWALVDENGDFRADRKYEIAKGLNMPNGVAVRDGALYVAEIQRILRFDNIESSLASPPKPVIVKDGFPEDEWHGWKFIRFGPDGRLYIPIGAPCNICEKQKKYAQIGRLDVKTGQYEVFAKGIRNSVGFDWHPETNELWFTDNGRDMLGEDIPPDELNRAPKKGMDFGFPYCHGQDISDPEFGKKKPCRDTTPPAQDLGPHVASLGMRFYTGNMFPEEYRNAVFIAEHGSWNRSKPIGYRVTVVRLKEDGTPASYDIFAEGWLSSNDVWGRPVDIEILPDGSMLVSDDHGGRIYRISYKKP